VSVDTFRASVAREAVKAGARMVNDVTAGRRDSEMLRAVCFSFYNSIPI
jgi:dihydropteroate synthase